MGVRTFVRPVGLLAIDSYQINSQLNTALGLGNVLATANASNIFVSHATLVDNTKDSIIQGVIDAYVYDPAFSADFGLSTEFKNLRGIVSTLRQWAQDAAAVDTGWSGTTYTATKDGQLRILFRRNALFLDRFADLLTVLGGQSGN